MRGPGVTQTQEGQGSGLRRRGGRWVGGGKEAPPASRSLARPSQHHSYCHSRAPAEIAARGSTRRCGTLPALLPGALPKVLKGPGREVGLLPASSAQCRGGPWSWYHGHLQGHGAARRALLSSTHCLIAELQAVSHLPSLFPAHLWPQITPLGPPHFAPREGGPGRCGLLWTGGICPGLAWLLKAELCRPLEPLAGCAGRSTGRHPGSLAVTQTNMWDSHHWRKQPPHPWPASSRHSRGLPTRQAAVARDRPGRAPPGQQGPTGPAEALPPASALRLQSSSISQNTKYKKVADRMWLPTARAPGRGRGDRQGARGVAPPL